MSLKKITTRFAILMFLFTAMACVQEEEIVYDLDELDLNEIELNESAVDKCKIGWPPPTPEEVAECKRRNKEKEQ